MEISNEDFDAFVPKFESKKGQTTNIAVNILRLFYCKPMNMKGICPGRCVECQQRITDMTTWDDPNNWEAMLTWCAKDGVADAQEKSRETKPIKAGFVSDTGNLFDNILQQIGVDA